jgi:energy-coupling factor transporter transmembrane protein EcfT
MNLLVKSPLRFSLIAIFFVVLMFFISVFLDKNPVIYSSNIIFIGPLMAIFLFFSIKIYRDTNPDGLRFWQGFSIGILYTLFFTAFYAIVLWADGTLFETNHFDEYRQMITEKIISGKEMLVDQMGEEGYQEYLESGESSNARIIGSLAVNNIIIGIVVTPLVSLFMRTSEPKRL